MTNLDIIEMVSVADIFSDPEFNCRGEIIPFDVISLAKNIESNGLMSPIMVQPWDKEPGKKYRIVVGHRRFLATKNLKQKEIKAIVKVGLTEEQAHILNIMENVERKDLNVLQEARAIFRFKLAGKTQREVASLLGVSSGWVQTRYTLLDLPIEIQNEAAAGFLTSDHIKQLGNMLRDDQFATVRAIKDAKIKGGKAFKIPSKNKKKPQPHKKKIRNTVEIEVMQDMIIDGVGNNLATRALAWTIGYISDIEFLQDIKALADVKGIPWSIPAEIIAEL